MALTVVVNISSADELALKNDLLDIDDWVQKAVAGKINNSKKRMVREWQKKLTDDPAVIVMPANDDALISVVVARPDYKDRAAREAEK